MGLGVRSAGSIYLTGARGMPLARSCPGRTQSCRRQPPPSCASGSAQGDTGATLVALDRHDVPLLKRTKCIEHGFGCGVLVAELAPEVQYVRSSDFTMLLAKQRNDIGLNSV